MWRKKRHAGTIRDGVRNPDKCNNAVKVASPTTYPQTSKSIFWGIFFHDLPSAGRALATSCSIISANMYCSMILADLHRRIRTSLIRADLEGPVSFAYPPRRLYPTTVYIQSTYSQHTVNIQSTRQGISRNPEGIVDASAWEASTK